MKRIGDDVMVNVEVITTRRMTLADASRYMVEMKHQCGSALPSDPEDGKVYEVARTHGPHGDTVTKAKITLEKH